MGADCFLVERPVPGSDACILIGRAGVQIDPPADPWRAVLWLVDGAGVDGGRAFIPSESVSVLPVDQSTATQLEAGIVDFLTRMPKHLPSIYVTRWIPPEHEACFANAIAAVVASVESHQRARVTRQQDAFAWQSHLFDNLGAYTAHRLPDQWEGALAGIPAFVCGAGPSLDVSAQVLARVAAGGVVFAADSSLRALAKAGVQADFAVSVDVAKTPSKCLPDSLPPDRVILSVNSPPDWLNAISPGRCRFISSNQLTLDWLASQGVSRTRIGVCENCGATAMELARFLGCYPICLFGMDLSLNAEGPLQRHHSAVETTVYSNSGFNPQEQFPRVPGNFSPDVPTHVIGDWRALDRRLAGWPAGLVWVVTDRGAKLSNTTVVRPADFTAPEAKAQKQSRLGALPETGRQGGEPLRVISEKLGQFGGRLVEWAPSLRGTLEAGGPNALAASLRSLFATAENGQMLGAYSLKLMPHLLPPIKEEGIDWAAIISELESLGSHAARAARPMQFIGLV